MKTIYANSLSAKAQATVDTVSGDPILVAAILIGLALLGTNALLNSLFGKW